MPLGLAQILDPSFNARLNDSAKGADAMSENNAPTVEVDTPEKGESTHTVGEQAEPEKQPQSDKLLSALKNERDRAKKAERDLKELQSRLQEFEDRDKTEAQRQLEALQRAQRDAETAQTEMVKLRVAMRHGIPEEDYDLLGAGDEETLNARAERLSAKNAASAVIEAQQAAPARRPVEQLKPGATPVDELPADDSYPAHWLPGT